jgi:hypothetical protein
MNENGLLIKKAFAPSVPETDAAAAAPIQRFRHSTKRGKVSCQDSVYNFARRMPNNTQNPRYPDAF